VILPRRGVIAGRKILAGNFLARGRNNARA
jgi:hypothetical protein